MPVSATGGSDLSSQQPALRRTLAAFFTLSLSQPGVLCGPLQLSSLRVPSGTSAGSSGPEEPAASTAADHLQPPLLKAPLAPPPPPHLCLHRPQLPQSRPAPTPTGLTQPVLLWTAWSCAQHSRRTSASPALAARACTAPSPGPHTRPERVLTLVTDVKIGPDLTPYTKINSKWVQH